MIETLIGAAHNAVLDVVGALEHAPAGTLIAPPPPPLDRSTETSFVRFVMHTTNVSFSINSCESVSREWPVARRSNIDNHSLIQRHHKC